MSEKEAGKERIDRKKILTLVSWIVCGFIFIYYFYLYSTSPGSFKTLLFPRDSIEKIDATTKSGIILTEAKSLWGGSVFNRDRLSIDPDEFTIEKNSILSGTQTFTIPHSRVKQVTFTEGYTCSTVSIITEGGIIFPDRESFSIKSKEGYKLVKVSVEAMCNISNNKFIIVEKKSLLKRVMEWGGEVKKHIWIITGLIFILSNPYSYAWDWDINTLPAGFKGNDFATECKKAEKSKPKDKGEFESTDSYNARMELFHKKIVSYLVPIVMVPDTDYDADSKIMSVIIRSDSHDDIKIIYSEKKGKTYTCQNAFGAKWKCQNLDTFTAAVRYWNKEEGPDNVKEIFKPVEFELSNERAKLSKDRIRVALIIQPTHHGCNIYSQKQNATIENPYNVTYNTFALTAYIRGMYVYDMKTGDVFRKIRVTKSNQQ